MVFLKDVKYDILFLISMKKILAWNEVIGMKCTLMHKRIAVAELELDDATGFIQKIKKVYARCFTMCFIVCPKKSLSSRYVNPNLEYNAST